MRYLQSRSQLLRTSLGCSARSPAALGTARAALQRSLVMSSSTCARVAVPLVGQSWLHATDGQSFPSSQSDGSDRAFTLATWNVLADGLAQTGGWVHVRMLPGASGLQQT